MKGVAVKVYISGIVQGVGFRPFIYRLARKYGLKGYVRNLGGSEVEVHIEGTRENIDRFLKDIPREKPPPARIEEIRVKHSVFTGFKTFEIRSSGRGAKLYSMIPPDFGICEHCISEILNPNSRHYRYPFNSCAWCGPRFSIIEKLPYDRENTSMRDFPLCEYCKAEYNDPDNIRRFHIQGISCPICGPKIWLETIDGEKIDAKDPLSEAAKLINEGYILAIKGLGGFHIASLATDDDIVLELRRRKRRKNKPFALMALDIETASKIVKLSKEAIDLLSSPEKPILLLDEKEDSPVSRFVAPGLDKQGIMLPYTGIHYLLLMETKDKFLIMTSGNMKGKPMCTDIKCAKARLSDIVDFFVFHNRRIVNRVDDSVLRFTDGEVTFLRRSRGYAPAWIHLPFKLERPIIAFGAELQNVGAIGFDDKVVLTQYIGDTDEIENLDYLKKALRFFIKTYNIDLNEAILVSDKHPNYSSVILANRWKAEYRNELLKIQHHVAHVASVMAEKKLGIDSEVIGIAIDGLGYGDDGNIWGGEIFTVTYEKYERVGHLEYHGMPGGDLSVIYPLRMLISILSKKMDIESIIDLINKFKIGDERTRKYPKLVLRQLEKAKKTSSMGRVLDSISCLLGICCERTYEGEPAIRLEAAARGGKLINDLLDIPIKKINGKDIVCTSELLVKIINHLDKRRRDLAYTAQISLGRALGMIARDYAEKKGLEYIIVSGGAAVNTYIVRGIKEAIVGDDLRLLLPNRVPAGDGGIALGQVAIAGARYLA